MVEGAIQKEWEQENFPPDWDEKKIWREIH
jgi:hypothetical protein